MTDEEAKALGATHFRINGFGWKRYYAFKHGGWWLLCIDDEWYPDYEINPKDKLELIDEMGMNIEEIRKNAPVIATHYRVKSNGKIMYYFFGGGDLFIISRRWRLIPSAFRVDDGEIKPLH